MMTKPTIRSDASVREIAAIRAERRIAADGSADKARFYREIEKRHVKDAVFEDIEQEFLRQVNAVALGTKESRAIVIVAHSGAGKTHTIEHIIKTDRFADRADEFGTIRPLVSVSAPSPCTLKTLGIEIIKKMTGEEMRVSTKEHEIWRRVRNEARNLAVEVIVIDELHHLFENRNWKEIETVLSTLKRLLIGETSDRTAIGGYLPITLLLAGLPHLADIIAGDTQLLRRSTVRPIDPLEAGEDGIKQLTDFVRSIDAALSHVMGKPQNLATPDMILRLRSAGNFYCGRVAYLLKLAAKRAVDDGTFLIDRVKHLSKVYRDIHRATEKGNDCVNPFLIADPTKLPPHKAEVRSVQTLVRGKRNQRKEV